MAQINVTINGRSLRMACDDGEEGRLTALAERFDGWVTELRSAFGDIGDQRLTVMAGIMATDHLAEAERTIARLEEEVATLKKTFQKDEEALQTREIETAEALDTVAARLEVMAVGLSKSLKPG